MSVVSRATYEVQDAWFYLSNGYYAEVSLWVWVFIGVTLYWIFRRRRSRYRGPGRTRSAQLKKQKAGDDISSGKRSGSRSKAD